ncbi:MAG TPA: response regulator transcription factor [Acidimicrobiia bacterium]|nr:response regulator transcription factor [Acidimicrobiia bacterium]
MPRPVGRILVVEDDEGLRTLMVRALEQQSHRVVGVSGAVAARGLLAAGGIDVVVLDLGLPDGDGLDLVGMLRERAEPAVLVVSGRDSLGDRVLGLDMGADDYLTKPVAVAELQARVRALLRRVEAPPARHCYGPLEIDLEAREVYVEGRPVELTRKEFGLLAALASAPRKVFGRDELLREVWGSSSEYQAEATVTEHVRRLRLKLGDDAEHPRWIVNVRGVGYRFDPGEETTAAS